MLYYFFSNQEKENAYLFDNLNVSKHQHLMIHQNQYPVIFLSLKDMNANTFQSQIYIFANLITSIIDKYADIQDSNFISDRDKNIFQSYSDIHLNINELRMSLKDISDMIRQIYKVELSVETISNLTSQVSEEVQKEPKLALEGGIDGLEFYRKIIDKGYAYLKYGGYICLEIGYDQKEAVTKIIEDNKQYRNTYCKKDLYDNDRVIITKLN